MMGRKPSREEAPPLAFWALAVSNTVGPALGATALRNITYPAQVGQGATPLYPTRLPL